MRNWQSPQSHYRRGHADAFTLIELIVVFGIVTIPIDVFMPTLTARPSARDAGACQSDMRQVARLLLGCANMFNGFVFPQRRARE